VDLTSFDRYGFFMGAAFQIQDDVLNLVGEREKYGKEIGGDILEGKRTLMLIHLLNACNSGEKEKLLAFLGKPRTQRTPRELRWVMKSMEKYGSIDHARSAARRLAGAALYEFGKAYGGVPDSPDKAFLEQLVLYMIERDL
jgi:geranylgeranyl diphosphate synthase type II